MFTKYITKVKCPFCFQYKYCLVSKDKQSAINKHICYWTSFDKLTSKKKYKTTTINCVFIKGSVAISCE